jgi:hypothetical protein
MKKYALFLAASASSRPEMKTAEHRIFAKPARPLTVASLAASGKTASIAVPPRRRW